MQRVLLDRSFEGFRWAALLPPNRPGLADIAAVLSALQASGAQQVAVLGSTPEFRIAASRVGAHVYVFEKDERFYHRISDDFNVPISLETLVVGDWVNTLSQYPQKFDAVLSDLTLGNVPFDLQFEFQRSACAILRPGGLLVDRVLHYRRGLSNPKDLTRFTASPVNVATANELVCWGLFRSPTVREAGRVDSTLAVDYLLHLEPKLEPLVRVLSHYLCPRGIIWNYSGQFRDPALVYKECLSEILEIESGVGGYEGSVSLMIGKR